MKIAISNIAWEKSEDDAVAKLLHKYSVAGIEIAPTKIWDSPTEVLEEKIKDCASYWADQGISIVATQSILFGHPELTIFPDEKTRTKTLNYLKQMIRVSKSLGAKVIVFGSPKNRVVGNLDQKAATEIATKFFYELGEGAKEYDVLFCIEPNAKQYGTDFVTNTDEAVDFVARVNHPNFRLHLDAGVMTLNGEDYQTAISKALPYLCHFHISEPFLDHIGSVDTDHKAIASALRSVQYAGCVSIEMKSAVLSSNLDAVDKSLKLVTEVYY